MKRDIEVTVNGTKHQLSIEPRETLLEIIRQHLDLTGAKLGCDQQVCGTCTVLLDGLPVSSCSVLGVDAEGCEVLTIEGLASDGDLHPIQQAFIDTGAFQCAFCTPGMILAVKALKDQLPAPSEEQIRQAGL